MDASRLDSLESSVLNLTRSLREERTHRTALQCSVDDVAGMVRELQSGQHDVMDIRRALRELEQKISELSPVSVAVESLEEELKSVLTENKRLKKDSVTVGQHLAKHDADIQELASAFREKDAQGGAELRKLSATMRERDHEMSKLASHFDDINRTLTTFQTSLSVLEDRVKATETIVATTTSSFESVRVGMEDGVDKVNDIAKGCQRTVEMRLAQLDSKIKQGVSEAVESSVGYVTRIGTELGHELERYRKALDAAHDTHESVVHRAGQMEKENLERWEQWEVAEARYREQRSSSEASFFEAFELKFVNWIQGRAQDDELLNNENSVRQQNVFQDLHRQGLAGIRELLDAYKAKMDRIVNEDDVRRRQLPNLSDERIDALVSELLHGCALLARQRPTFNHSPPSYNNNNNNISSSRNDPAGPEASASSRRQDSAERGNSNNHALWRDGQTMNFTPTPVAQPSFFNVNTAAEQTHLEWSVKQASILRDRRHAVEADIERVNGVLSALHLELESINNTPSPSPRGGTPQTERLAVTPQLGSGTSGLLGDLSRAREDLHMKERSLQDHRDALWKNLTEIKEEERNVNDEIRHLSQQMLRSVQR
eukprot:PhM_4_TR15362/c0_g2_i1/m.71625